MGNAAPDPYHRASVLQLLGGTTIAGFMATLGAYLGHQDRVAVGAFLILSLVLLLATTLAFSFYGVADSTRLRVATSVVGVVFLGFIGWVAIDMAYQPDAPWDVRIISLVCDDDPEHVTIRNFRNKPQAMTGWTLESDPHQEFDLSKIERLNGGETITVFSYRKAPDDDPANGYYLWDHNPKFRNDDPTDYARLVSDTGEVVHTVHCGQLVPQPPVNGTATPTRTPTPTPAPTHISTPTPTPTAGGEARYEVTVQFNTSVMQDDIDEVDALLRAYDDDLEFLIMESFPPIGRALLATDAPDFCQTVEAELQAKSYVDDVSCRLA